MDVSEAVKQRRSIRRFKPDPVSNDDIQTLLESARLAPSGTNSQPWRFIVVKSDETKKMLRQAAHNQRHVGDAPVVIVCCGNLGAFMEFPERVDELIDAGALPKSSRKFFVPALKKGLDNTPKDSLKIAAAGNCAIAITNIMLQATELGLGTCWVRWFDDDKVRSILDIPEEVELMALLPVGVPDENPATRPRVMLEDIVYSEKYGKKLYVNK